MDTHEKNLLVETDQMTESNLVRMDDWKLAHLRVAMLRQVEETLSEVMSQGDDATTRCDSPRREARVDPRISSAHKTDTEPVARRIKKPRPSGRGCGANEYHSVCEHALISA